MGTPHEVVHWYFTVGIRRYLIENDDVFKNINATLDLLASSIDREFQAYENNLTSLVSYINQLNDENTTYVDIQDEINKADDLFSDSSNAIQALIEKTKQTDDSNKSTIQNMVLRLQKIQLQYLKVVYKGKPVPTLEDYINGMISVRSDLSALVSNRPLLRKRKDGNTMTYSEYITSLCIDDQKFQQFNTIFSVLVVGANSDFLNLSISSRLFFNDNSSITFKDETNTVQTKTFKMYELAPYKMVSFGYENSVNINDFDMTEQALVLKRRRGDDENLTKT